MNQNALLEFDWNVLIHPDSLSGAPDSIVTFLVMMVQ